jgi:uncharacterized membrane protein YGL010W
LRVAPANPNLRSARTANVAGATEERAMLTLNAEWTELLRDYKREHADPRNQACHRIGIPLIAASLPIGATIVGLPLAVPMFTVGWGFQFLGHWFEGNDPAFFGDRRNLLVGLVWWLQKQGVRISETKPS